MICDQQALGLLFASLRLCSFEPLVGELLKAIQQDFGSLDVLLLLGQPLDFLFSAEFVPTHGGAHLLSVGQNSTR